MKENIWYNGGILTNKNYYGITVTINTQRLRHWVKVIRPIRQHAATTESGRRMQEANTTVSRQNYYTVGVYINTDTICNLCCWEIEIFIIHYVYLTFLIAFDFVFRFPYGIKLHPLRALYSFSFKINSFWDWGGMDVVRDMFCYSWLLYVCKYCTFLVLCSLYIEQTCITLAFYSLSM